MHELYSCLSPSDFRSYAAPLRERYGPQPWLTVASGPVAEGYRLAGLSGEDFAELLHDQVEERGRLLLQLRRKPIMRLRTGFDGHSGVIHDDDGVLVLHLPFETGGSYGDRGYSSGLRDHADGSTLRLRTRPQSSLLITGTMRRPLASVFPSIPRCLHAQSIVTRSITCEKPDWSPEGYTSVRVQTHWETLALMPLAISRELGLPAQTRLDQIPWMLEPHPVRRPPLLVAPERGIVDQPAGPARNQPKLRLVATS